MLDYLSKNKKLGLHVIFWIIYYVSFSIIWVINNDYKDSFYLEFIFLPLRVLAVYVTILFLIPQFLLKKEFVKFLFIYIVFVALLGLIQLGFLYLFYEDRTLSLTISGTINFNTFIRCVMLINSTVFFVSAIYILNLYFSEKELRLKMKKNDGDENLKIQLKSNRRNYLISPDEIIYIEGLGNYVNYYIENGKKITVYQSLKKCKENLPEEFLRIHKSYIVNKNKILSFANESVELNNNQILPIGNSFGLINFE